MTKHRCIEATRIGDVADLPAEHVDRRHAEDCARCRSLLASYRLFMSARGDGDADPAGARATLDAFLDRLPPVPAARAQARAPARELSRWGWLRRWSRLVPAAAAVLLVVAVVMMQSGRETAPTVLRESPSVQTAPLSMHAPRTDDGGTVYLSWSPVPDADQYDVRFFGDDLTMVHRLTVADTTVAVDRSAFPAGSPAPLDLTWRVTALRHGDAVRESAPASVRIP